MRAANSTGSAEPSGNSDIDNAFATRSRDFNLKNEFTRPKIK